MQNVRMQNVLDQNLSARMCTIKTQDRTLQRFGKDREAEIHLFIEELKLQQNRFCIYFWILLKQFVALLHTFPHFFTSSEKMEQQLTN